MLRRVVVAALFSFAAYGANAQNSGQIVPSGNFTPGHTIRCQNNKCTVAVDAGGSAGSRTAGVGYLTEIGITNTGTPFCINDALTSVPYRQLCFGANSLGGGLISYNAYGGASPLTLNFVINGVTYPFPGSGNGNVDGPVSTTDKEFAVWNGTSGTLLEDGATTAITHSGAITINGGGIISSQTHTFWDGPTGKQWRLANRVFMGPAVVDTGINASPQADWLSQLTDPGSDVSAFGTGNFAQVYVLADPSQTSGSPSNLATPTQALMVGNESLNAISTGGSSYSTPRTFEIAAVNNVTAAPTGGGPHVPMWGIYGNAARYSANAGQTYFMEGEVSNFSSKVTGWTPYSATGSGTIGEELGCGGGLSSTGQYPCTVAMYVAANPMQFGAGLLFLDGSISNDATGTTVAAILMPYQYQIQWYRSGSTLAAQMYSDNQSNLNIMTAVGNINITSRISSVGNNASLNAPTGFVAGLTVNGDSGVNYDGSAFIPAVTNATGLGETIHEWSVGYIKTLVADALPTSAGGGGLYVCVDTSGVFYKKSTCP